jgi:hypothetical protein
MNRSEHISLEQERSHWFAVCPVASESHLRVGLILQPGRASCGPAQAGPDPPITRRQRTPRSRACRRAGRLAGRCRSRSRRWRQRRRQRWPGRQGVADECELGSATRPRAGSAG